MARPKPICNLDGFELTTENVFDFLAMAYLHRNDDQFDRGVEFVTNHQRELFEHHSWNMFVNEDSNRKYHFYKVFTDCVHTTISFVKSNILEQNLLCKVRIVWVVLDL